MPISAMFSATCSSCGCSATTSSGRSAAGAISSSISLCGAVGGLVFVANDPHSKIELIGASGAIAGVVIAYVMLRPCAKITVLLGIIPLRISAYWVVGLFVILQLWHLGSASKSEVAYWCHFGGMLAGAVLFPLMKPPGVKLFQCMQPVPDTVVQIGPSRGPRARPIASVTRKARPLGPPLTLRLRAPFI